MEPTEQACFLSAFVRHAQMWLDEHPGRDPAVLININGGWCPVLAGIEETGEHRNAVKIDCVQPDVAIRFVIQESKSRIGSVVSGLWVDREPAFSALDDAQMAFANVREYPLDRSYRVVQRTYFGAEAEGKYVEEVVL